jgi:hypothetical protein
MHVWATVYGPVAVEAASRRFLPGLGAQSTRKEAAGRRSYGDVNAYTCGDGTADTRVETVQQIHVWVTVYGSVAVGAASRRFLPGLGAQSTRKEAAGRRSYEDVNACRVWRRCSRYTYADGTADTRMGNRLRVGGRRSGVSPLLARLRSPIDAEGSGGTPLLRGRERLPRVETEQQTHVWRP